MRSTRSSSRARTSERGFALIAAIILAVLYVGLIELLLLDSARELNEARRFRARIVAATLAENAAELAAVRLIDRQEANVNGEDWQGTISGWMLKGAEQKFQIHGEGTTSGVVKTSASVDLSGKIEGTNVKIEYAVHRP